jgi:predicted amidophosphoribosyltransferase
MGLYLKCPGCHAEIPLYEKVCSQCGQSLENLPRAQRVYVIAPAAAPSGKAAPAAKALAPGPATAAKKAKGPRKKKA